MFLFGKSGRRAFVYSFQPKQIFKYPALAVFLCSFLFLSKINVLAIAVSPDPSFDVDGKVFTTFNPYTADPGNDIVVQPDGKIIVAGSGLDQSILLGRWVMARYNPDGSLDSTFGNGGRVITPIGGIWDRCNSLALRADGKIIVAGDKIFNTGDAFDSNVVVARYTANGTLENITQTDVPGTNTVNDVTLLADNRIFVAGIAPNATPFAALYSADLALETGFDGDGIISVAGLNLNAVASQTDGKLLIAGQLNSNWTVWRYNQNGTLDTTFDGDGIVNIPVGVSSSAASEMLVKPDGKILTVGTATITDSDLTLVQFNSNGSLDTSFDGDGKVFTNTQNNETGKEAALQPDGKIVALASVGTIFYVTRYLPNGALDTTFDGDGITSATVGTSINASALALQPDGKIVATGSSRQDGFAVVRFTARAAQAFDFDGDGKTDISIFRPSNGEWWYLKSSNGGNGAFQFGTSTDKLTPGDFTGDGKTDIAFWRAGEWFVLRSEDNSYFSHPFGTTGDIPAPGDFDGDGAADAAVFRPSNGTWYIRTPSGGATVRQFGANGDAPVAADYDGDGKSDVAIWRAPVGQWWIQRSSNLSTYAFTFGVSSDKPVQGDYTGDGRADAAFWRPSNGFWFVLRSEDFSFFSFPFGVSTDIPAPGDYDGDAQFDATVYRPSDLLWFVRRSGSTVLIQNYGESGDRPVPNAFVP